MKVDPTLSSGSAFRDPDEVLERLAGVAYLADERIATSIFIADVLGKPVLCEGPAGVGKTELAKAVAQITGRRLIRLQCYEGLDESKALYEWNYKKQLLRIQAEPEDAEWEKTESDIFDESFLLERPLLAAIRSVESVVLLIDEVDRIEVETEALLLEILSDFQVSVPELGTIVATSQPSVFLTSNNTRELSEALKRRCVFLDLEYPTVEREQAIIEARIPGISSTLAANCAEVVSWIRSFELKKPPSVSETSGLGANTPCARPSGIDAGRHSGDFESPPQVLGRHRQDRRGVEGSPLMRNITEDTVTEATVALIKAEDPRLAEVMESLIRHLHAFIREIELTEEEWMAGIRFLTETGQISDDKRQEFILLSDTLGASILVDAINHRKSAGSTDSTVFGPFWVSGSPHLENGAHIARGPEAVAGETTVVHGVVKGRGGMPLPGASLDVWQASPEGLYDVQDSSQPEMNLRGLFHTDDDGRYWFVTVKPAAYPIPDDGPVG